MKAGRDDEVRRARRSSCGRGRSSSPTRRRGLCDAEAQERQRRDLEHGRGDAQGAGHDERREGVGEDRAGAGCRPTTRRAPATRSRSRARGSRAPRAAHDARVERDGTRSPMASWALTSPLPRTRDDGDGQEQGREGEQDDVHDAHEDVVGHAAGVARRRAPMIAPMMIAKPTTTRPMRQRDPGAVDDAAEDVADVAVGAEVRAPARSPGSPRRPGWAARRRRGCRARHGAPARRTVEDVESGRRAR